MISETSDTCIDLTVERLKRKYLHRRKRVPQENVNRLGERDLPHNIEDYETAVPRMGRSVDHQRKCYDKALQELFQAVSNVPGRLGCADDWEPNSSLSDDEDGCSTEESGTTSDAQDNINTETDVTLPSCFAKGSGSLATDGTAQTERLKRPSPPADSRSTTHVSRVYQEMAQICEKLHMERSRLQQRAAQLEEWEELLREREAELKEREAELLHPCQALLKIRATEGAEEGAIHVHVRALQEQYQLEVQQLREALREKGRENRRMKANFDSIKELNDTMRNQLIDATEQNRKLESQSKKVQARLQNLQRKYEYTMARRGRESVVSEAQMAPPPKQDKPSLSSKSTKAPTSPSGAKLMVLLLDWVTDCHLNSGLGVGWSQGVSLEPSPYTGSVQERCSKVLPMLAEQLQLVSKMQKGLLIPLLKFIYLSLRLLDTSPQQHTLTSTMRRLGEEMYRDSGPQGGALDVPAASRVKTSVLFRSPCLHTRFLSTLIILRTISQADILAQALDCLHEDLRGEEGRELFLRYRALPVVLALLRGGGGVLLGVSIDILLQMATESRLLSSFLEACSTEDFFRCLAALLRNPRQDITLVEKIGILLQKLSKIRKNKRLFELCSIHLTLQEMHRTLDPSHAFLAINLNSILFNLGMIKRTPSSSSSAESP